MTSTSHPSNCNGKVADRLPEEKRREREREGKIRKLSGRNGRAGRR